MSSIESYIHVKTVCWQLPPLQQACNRSRQEGHMYIDQISSNGELHYHIIINSYAKKWFRIPLGNVWRIFVRSLEKTVIEYEISPHSFVLMNNHLHLQVSTPLLEIDSAIYFLLKEINSQLDDLQFSQHLQKYTINNLTQYTKIFRYILQNPLRAKICNSVDQYPLSSLSEDALGICTRRELQSNRTLFLPYHLHQNRGLIYWLKPSSNRTEHHLRDSSIL